MSEVKIKFGNIEVCLNDGIEGQDWVTQDKALVFNIERAEALLKRVVKGG